MANPWYSLLGQDEPETEPENPWLAFTQPISPAERLRRMQERYPDALPGLNEPGEEPEEKGFFDRAEDYQKARRRSFGASWKRNLWDLTQIPETLLQGSQAVKRAILPEALEGPATQQEGLALAAIDALTPDFVREGRERAAREAEEAQAAKAEAGVALGLPDALQAAENFGEDFTTMALDPLELLPGGLAAQGVSRLRRGARAGEAAVELAEKLPRAAAAENPFAELARKSLAIGESPPATQRAAQVVDDTPADFGAVRRIRTLDREGRAIGEMTFTPEPGGGFRLMDVETVGRGTGGLRAMMIEANRISKGPYLGSLAETDEGAAAIARLRETDPELFVGPEVYLNAGERGHLKVPLGKPPGTPGFLTRWFSNWGDYAALGKEIGEPLAEGKRLASAAALTEGKRAEMLVRDADAAIKRYHKELPGDRPLQETLDYVLSGLEGEHAFDGAPMYLRNAVEAARGHLDELSEKFDTVLERSLRDDLIKSPEWQERAKDLRAIIRRNKGQWVRRSFEAFTNGDWAALVKAPDSPEHWRWTSFLEWAKGNGLDDLQAEGLANKYLRRDPEVFLGMGERTLIPRERLGSAKARIEGLPQQIDDLLGLHEDPLVRYRESVLALAHDIETLKLKTGLLEQGQGVIFFDEPLGEASEVIRGTTGLDPLAGKYATPEVHAVVSAISATRPEAAKTWVRHLAKATSLVKSGKTVFSPFVTHPRNLFSWVPMVTATGLTTKVLNPRRWARSARIVKAGKFGANLSDEAGAGSRALAAMAEHVQLADGRTLAEVADYSLEGLRARHLKLQRAGIIGESATAGDVAHYRGVLGEIKTPKSWKNERLSKAASKVWRAFEWLYGAEDDLGKIVAFEAAEHDLKWARAAEYQGLDDAGRRALDEEVFQEAARRTRDTTPTYSKIAPATRELRDFPLLSSFPTFWQEVYRNTKNGLKLALQDLRRTDNPRMQVLGAKRLAGLITAAGAPAALATAGMHATGFDREAVDALREFVPPWDRNANLAAFDVDGWSIGAVNLSYMMPHAIFSEPIIAAWRQSQQDEGPVEDVVEATLGATWEAVEPFASREILLDGMIDYIWKTRGELWDANAPIDQNARAIANAIYRTAAPGGILWLERVARASGFGEALEESAGAKPEGPSRATEEFIASLLQQVNQYGTEYQLTDELVAGGTGIRMNHYDVAKSMGFAARRFKRNHSDASAQWNRAKNHPGGLPPTTLAARRREAEAKFREGWEVLRRQVEAMRTVGRKSGKPDYIIERDVASALKDADLGQKWIESVMDGRYVSPF